MRRSGIPVLLNTSFNVAGEPIVNRGARGVFDVPALWDRRARRRADAGHEASFVRRPVRLLKEEVA
jgi:Carbamoyltransferase C-terminus